MTRAYDDYGNVVDLVEHDKQIRAEVRKELLSLADCKDKECWDCPFGTVDGCKLKENKNE